MSAARTGPPANLRHLVRLVDEVARSQGRPVRRVQRAVANTVVGQMLPPGVVKGGTAMKLRVGEAGSRFTPDLDAARPDAVPLDTWIDALAERLAAGWHGFTGTVSANPPPRPDQVPDDYVMRPFDIRLAYRGRHWLTVPFELGRDEVGSTLVPELRMAADIEALFASLGLPRPEPVALLALDHQVAQKLHACTSVDPRTGGNERAHDLVDLQILDQEEAIDLVATGTTARRLFASRRRQAWPPVVRAFARWDTIYAEAADGLGVLATVDEAVAWANALIARIDRAGS